MKLPSDLHSLVMEFYKRGVLGQLKIPRCLLWRKLSFGSV